MSSGTYDASASSGEGGLIDVTARDLRALSAPMMRAEPLQGACAHWRVFQGGKALDLSQSYIDSFVTRWPETPCPFKCGKDLHQ